MSIIVDDKKRIAKETNVRNRWKDIRSEREELTKFLSGEKDIGNGTNARDLVLCYQCISLILEHISVYEQDIKKAPDKIEGIDPTPSKIEQLYGESAREVFCLFVSDNEKMPIDQRLKAVEQIRLVAWKQILKEKQNLTSMVDETTNFQDLEEQELLLRCVSITILEMDMQDQEIKILEKLYNNPDK